MCKTLLPLKLDYWLIQMIGHFLAKRNTYFIFSAPSSSSVQKTFPRKWTSQNIFEATIFHCKRSISDIHSLTLHLGSGIAEETSWSRRSWTRLEGRSTHFAVFQKRILKQKIWPKKCLKMIYFLKKKHVKITSALGAPLPTLVGGNRRLWVPPPDLRVVLILIITNFLSATF